MKSDTASLLRLLFSIIATFISSSMFMTFTSIQMKTLGYSDITIGLIHSGYYFGILLGVYFGEKIISSHGYIKVFMAAISLFGIAVVIMETSQAPIVWLGARITSGAALGTLYLVLESWLVKVTPKEFRSRALSLYTILIYSGQIIGQFLFSKINIDSSLPYNLAVFFNLCAIPPIALNNIESPKAFLPDPEGIKKIVKKTRVSCFFAFCSGMMISSLYSFIPIWAQQLNLNPAGITALLIIGGVIFLFPIGNISDLIDRRKVLFVIALVIALTSLPSSYFFYSKYSIYFIILTLGATTFALYPITLSHTLDNFNPSKYMKVNSTMLILYGLGSTVGPVYSSLWMHYSINTGLFYSLATITIPLSALAIYAIVSRSPTPLDDKIEYMPLPSRSAQIVVRLEDQIT